MSVKNPLMDLGIVVDASLPITTDPAPVVAGVPAKANDDGLPEFVVDLNRRYALVRLGDGVMVADFETPTVTARGTVRSLGFLDVAGFRAMWRGQWVPPLKPGDKARPLAEAWLEHPGRRQYEGVTFAPPPAPAPGPGILNLWRGFGVEPKAGDVSPWLAVLGHVLPREDERVYVLHWLAWKVQNPGGVPDTVLILAGAKGAGKNSLFDPVLSAFGAHGMLCDDPEQIAGRFTGHLVDKAFMVLDEAVFAGDPKQSDRIKSRVTAKDTTYEAKGKTPAKGVNRCAFVMLTNHDHVWQATTDERRAVVVEVGQGLRGQHDFWTRYHAWAEGEGTPALLHYLMSLDVSGFNPRRIPKGEALRRQVEMTALRDPVAAWWHRCLGEGAASWPGGRTALAEDEATLIDAAALRESFEHGAHRGYASWALAAKRLAQWAGPDGLRRVRPRDGGARVVRYELPALAVLRESFTRATGVAFDAEGQV